MSKFKEWYATIDRALWDMPENLARTAYRAGQAEMRERAAVVLDNEDEDILATSLRTLPLEGDLP